MNAAAITDQDLVLQIPLCVAVEVGSRTMTIRELLKLGVGSVVELERVAGEALDIRVNGRLVSRGEVVAINDSYGVRFLDVVSAEQLGADPLE
jgi:flagellar motor switch protein FliN